MWAADWDVLSALRHFIASADKFGGQLIDDGRGDYYINRSSNVIGRSAMLRAALCGYNCILPPLEFGPTRSAILKR